MTRTTRFPAAFWSDCAIANSLDRNKQNITCFSERKDISNFMTYKPLSSSCRDQKEQAET